MSDALNRLLREHFEYNMTNVHTAFPGTVETYEPATRRADIQPFLKRKLPAGGFMNFPIIPDVPVVFFGTKKFTIHAPLEKGDEVLVVVCERSTDNWRDNGGAGIEDSDPRRFNLMDCFALPGLQPVEFIAAEEPGLQVIHHDGDLISQLLMVKDKIELKHKKKFTLLIEDNRIKVETAQNVFELDDDITLNTSKTGLIEIGNAIATLGAILNELFTALENHHSEGAPATHTSKTWAATNITPLKQKTVMVFKK